MKKKVLSKLQDKLKLDFAFGDYIKNIEKSKPYVDTATGIVYWGSDASSHKERDKN